MTRFIYLLSLSCLLAASAAAQSSVVPVTQVILFTATTSPATAPPGTSAGQIANVGQFGHRAFVVFTAKTSPTNGCDSSFTPGWTGGMQYSYNNSTWFSLGTQGSNSSTTSQLLDGFGSFPYVRLTVSWTNTDCRLSAWYTGSVYQTPILGVQGAAPLNSSANFGSATAVPPPVLIGGVGNTVGSNSLTGSMIPAVSCPTTLAVDVAAGATGLILAASSGARFYICSLSLLSDTVAATATLIEGTGGTCGSAPTGTLAKWAGLAVGVPVGAGAGLGPIMRAQQLATGLCLTAAVGRITGSVSLAVLPSTAVGY